MLTRGSSWNVKVSAVASEEELVFDHIEPYSQRCRWCGAGEALFDLTTGRAVLLTTMPLDGDPSNCENWNLVTACRTCHAADDAPEVTASRAATRWWKHIEAGQLDLLPEML